MVMDNTAVTVRGVFTHADIADQIHFRIMLFGFAEGSLDNAVVVICLAAGLILMLRNAKEHDLIDSGIK